MAQVSEDLNSCEDVSGWVMNELKEENRLITEVYQQNEDKEAVKEPSYDSVIFQRIEVSDPESNDKH
jgi:hypothetical protein